MSLKLAYIGLTITMSLILIYFSKTAIYRTHSETRIRKRKLGFAVLGLVLWNGYLFALASSGLLLDMSFPPRFVIFMILPAFLFTGVFISKNRNQEWIQRIPSQWLLYYQSFRILIETIFVYSVTAGVLHPNVTILGYNYDMIFAYATPIVGLLVFQFNILPRTAIVIWNYLGLLVITSIIFLFLTTIYFPRIYGDIEIFPNEFGMYPYVLVPGFLMPSAVFIHVLSLVQFKKSQITEQDT